MSNKLFTGTPSRSKLAHDQDNELHALLTFNPPAVDEEERAPIDIAVVLDRSGSMDGEKIDYAKRSLLKLVEHLKPQDTLSLTVFDSSVDLVFGTTQMDEEGRRTASEEIGKIYARSATNLSGGLFMGLDLLRKLKPDGRVRKCLLFTDGHANAGIFDTDQLLAAAQEYRCGIGISTFGYGSNHDARLLDGLAMDGSFYYIDSPDKILQAFGAELGGLISTYAQNVKVRLSPAEGVEIVEVLNDLTVDPDGKDVVVHADDLLAEIPYHICLKLKCEKRVKGPGPREVALVHATAKYTNVVEKRPDETTLTLKAKFVKPAEANQNDNAEVMREVAVFEVAKAQLQASSYADAGNYIMAGNVLRDASNLAFSYGNNTMGEVAQATMSCVSDEGAYTSGGREKNFATRGLLSRRRVGGAMGQSIGNVSATALYDSLGASNSAVKKMTNTFEADSVDVVYAPKHTASGASFPGTYTYGDQSSKPAVIAPSTPEVKDTADKKKEEVSKDSTPAKKRSTRW